MIDYTLQEVAALTGGVLMRGADESTRISSVSIDTRTLRTGALYVPVKGDAFDGHRFIGKAFEVGAAASFAEYDVPYPHIRVENAVQAFQKLAQNYRERFSIPFIGITGSTGKTTTKEMTAAVLSARFNTLYTSGNLNNQTGVPQVLFSLNDAHECAVIEMGTNHFGEIDALARMTEPDICMITNIGEAHIEFFGSREGIFRGKTEMLRHMRPGGTVIVNGDDDFLSTLQNTFTFGLGEKCRLRAIDIEEHGLNGVSFTALYEDKDIPVTVPVPGIHTVYNALAAMAAGIILGVPFEKIQSALASFSPLSGRLKIEKDGPYTLINDSYNANPASMLASLQVLSEADTHKVAILGDMLELGDKEQEGHEKVLMTAAHLENCLVVPVGPRMSSAAAKFGITAYESCDALVAVLPVLLTKGDTVLLKGSHGMHLENLVPLPVGK